MREIKFRGMDRLGVWVYGSLLTSSEFKDGHRECYIQRQSVHILGSISTPTENFTRVITESVGQFTGLYDDKGVEIYEGDILDFDEIEWGGKFTPEAVPDISELVRGDCLCGSISDISEWRTVIGNIHENPEYLTLKKRI